MNDGLQIRLAYLQNTWDKIKSYKNRQWGVLFIFTGISFAIIANQALNELLAKDFWTALLVIAIHPLLAFLTWLFCAHLRNKIHKERKVIHKFEEDYPEETEAYKTIREEDVRSEDFGDQIIYSTIKIYILFISALVFLEFGNNIMES